jgi:hypothetical protein
MSGSTEQTVRSVLQPVEAFITQSHNDFTEAIHKVLLPSLLNSSYALHSLKEQLCDAITEFGEQRFRDGVKSVETNESRIVLDVRHPKEGSISEHDDADSSSIPFVNDENVKKSSSIDKQEKQQLENIIKELRGKVADMNSKNHLLSRDINSRNDELNIIKSKMTTQEHMLRSEIDDYKTRVGLLEAEISRIKHENKMKEAAKSIVSPVMQSIRQESDAEDLSASGDEESSNGAEVEEFGRNTESIDFAVEPPGWNNQEEPATNDTTPEIEGSDTEEEEAEEEVDAEEEEAEEEQEEEEVEEEEEEEEVEEEEAEEEEAEEEEAEEEEAEEEEAEEEEAEEEEAEEEEAEEEEAEVEEYKFNGKIYYIIDKDEGPVYEYMDDGNIGDEIGKIVKGVVYVKGPSTNGKRVVWIKA